jgi:hypothetical protein
VRSGDRFGGLGGGWSRGIRSRISTCQPVTRTSSNEQPQELLFLVGVEVADQRADPFGEVVDSAVGLVAAGQGGALLGQAGSFRLQLAMTGGDGPSLQLGQLDQSGLVEVDQPPLLRVGGGRPCGLGVRARRRAARRPGIGAARVTACSPVSSRSGCSSARGPAAPRSTRHRRTR